MHSMSLLGQRLTMYGWRVEALRLGAGGTYYSVTSPRGHRGLVSQSDYKYPFATTMALRLAVDKAAAYDYVERNGVPIPPTRMVDPSGRILGEWGDKIKESDSLVIKPFDGSLSRGISVGVNTDEGLRSAVLLATQDSSAAIVQRQCEGQEYRCVIINGKVRSVIIRQRPYVVGDGVSSLRMLIDEENEARRKIANTVVTYPELSDSMLYDYLDMDVVPMKGERVELNRASMIRDGASVLQVTSTVHQSYIDLAERSVDGIGAGLIVADFLIQDIAVPANDENVVFLEFNTSPALSLFYSCRDGNHFDIVGDYLAPMLEQSFALSI